jgi:hypothetical protein
MNSALKTYGKTHSQTRAYLLNLLKTWPNADGKLLTTYQEFTRLDVYDNSLFVNALLTTDAALGRSAPDTIVISILDFLQDALINYIIPSGTEILLPAAYNYNPTTGVFGISPEEGWAQDVGNNAMVAIAMAKFCLVYPNHARTPFYLAVIAYLVDKFTTTMFCSNSTGVMRRYPLDVPENTSISTEHMVDLFALSTLALQLSVAGAGQLAEVSQNYVESTFQAPINPSKFYYAIGSNSVCSTTLNAGDGIPCDTTTWGVLSNVDRDGQRRSKAMKWIFANAYIDTAFPGISFAVPPIRSNGCAQYENTGAWLAAMTQYTHDGFGDLFSTLPDDQQALIIRTYAFLSQKITGGDYVQGAYEETKDNAGYSGCIAGSGCCSFIAAGWNYSATQRHLGSTCYSAFALLSIAETNNNNPYRLGPSRGDDDTPIISPEDDEVAEVWKTAAIALAVISGALAIALIVTGVLLSSKGQPGELKKKEEKNKKT